MGCRCLPFLPKQTHVCGASALDRRPLPLFASPPPKELEELYQDTASNLLVAICRHSWHRVTQHLETEVLTGVFPHRSLLYVMGVLTSNRTFPPLGPEAPQTTFCLQTSLVGCAG